VKRGFTLGENGAKILSPCSEGVDKRERTAWVAFLRCSSGACRSGATAILQTKKTEGWGAIKRHAIDANHRLALMFLKGW
jgi:hypothetical protein